MNEFGCSLTAHYRQLLSLEAVEELCRYLVFNPEVDIIELGYNGLSNYELFLSAYLMSKALPQASANATAINLHLPRRDWKEIGPEKIVADALQIDRLFGIKDFIIHAGDFHEFKEYLVPLLNKIKVENDSSGFQYDGALVCDVNHFLQDGKIDFIALGDYLSTYGPLVEEFHFAYLNHEMFGASKSFLIDKVFLYLRNIVDLRGKKIIFEGTNKKANSLDELIASLEEEIKIIKSKLNLCLV